MKKNSLVYGASLLLAILTGCSTAPKSQSEREMLVKEADLSIQKFKAADPDLQKFFDDSAGYAVFPAITKGGWFVGGAYGKGIMYEKGKVNGYVDTKHASIGLQFGGQSFSEIVFLETPEAVENLKYGKIKLSASVSAVAARAGASKAVKYAGNVAIFTLGEGGLMVEGAVGGQKFGYRPL
jgi:lipid-binding SYLF domain-containing protein